MQTNPFALAPIELDGVSRADAAAVTDAIAAADAAERVHRLNKSRLFFAIFSTGRMTEREPLSASEAARRKKARKAARASRKANR